MKTFALIFVALFGIATAMAQDTDHAPTVEQCRADYTLWSNVAGAGEKFDYADATYLQLNARIVEMFRCATVDFELERQMRRDAARIARDRERVRRRAANPENWRTAARSCPASRLPPQRRRTGSRSSRSSRSCRGSTRAARPRRSSRAGLRSTRCESLQCCCQLCVTLCY
jgi:hypothetical protein